MSFDITLSGKKFFRPLTFFFLFLQVGYSLTQYAKFGLGRGRLWGLTTLFDLNGENCIPSWYESGLFLICALLLYAVSISEKKIAQKPSRAWVGLAWIFVYLSLDETASIHEMTIEPLRHLLGINSGYFYYAWVIPAFFVVIILCWVFWKFFWSLPVLYRIRFFMAGSVFIAGALFTELLGANIASKIGSENVTYSLLVWIEESCEMLGLLIFISSLLNWLEPQN